MLYNSALSFFHYPGLLVKSEISIVKNHSTVYTNTFALHQYSFINRTLKTMGKRQFPRNFFHFDHFIRLVNFENVAKRQAM